MNTNQKLDDGNLSHTDALSWSEDVQESFADHRAAITALYPKLDAQAETSLDTALEDFRKCPTEEILDEDQELLLQQVTTARKNLFTRWQQFKPTLTNDLYPDNTVKQNRWGADNYEAATKSEDKLKTWAEQWIDCYTRFAADPGVSELAAPFQKTAIEGLYAAWKTADKAHATFQRDRPLVTQDRLLKKNTLLARARPFAEAGKATFIDDPVRRALFYQPRQPSEGATASATLRLQPNAVLPVDKLDLSDATSHLSVRLLTADGGADASLEVSLWRTDDPTGAQTTPGRPVTGSARTVFPLTELGAAGALLVVQNLTKQETVVKLSVVE